MLWSDAAKTGARERNPRRGSETGQPRVRKRLKCKRAAKEIVFLSNSLENCPRKGGLEERKGDTLFDPPARRKLRLPHADGRGPSNRNGSEKRRDASARPWQTQNTQRYISRCAARFQCYTEPEPKCSGHGSEKRETQAGPQDAAQRAARTLMCTSRHTTQLKPLRHGGPVWTHEVLDERAMLLARNGGGHYDSDPTSAIK